MCIILLTLEFNMFIQSILCKKSPTSMPTTEHVQITSFVAASIPSFFTYIMEFYHTPDAIIVIVKK